MPTAIIIKNKSKDTDGIITERVRSALSDTYDVVCIDEKNDRNLYNLCKSASVAIVLGGDGTILNFACVSALSDTPILGINLGNLGFLSDVELSELDSMLDRFKKGEYIIDERFMIEAVVSKNDGSSEEFLALNDVVFSRASYKRMVAFDIFLNGNKIASYSGDGAIVATPTGSTAYSMSAGGPIADPSLDIFLITPLCAHTFSAKPMVVPGNAEIEIRFCDTFDDMSIITVDGQSGCRVRNGDVIKVRDAGKKVKLIKVSGRNFYEILHKKFQG